MIVLRFLLSFFLIGILGFTFYAGSTSGWNLFPFFINELLAMSWNGQFHFDFLCYLTLSGLWIAWRHEFSFMGILLGMIGTIGGILFLAPYLLIESYRSKGELSYILLGKNRHDKIN
jgi:hypothetical protein